MKFKRILVKLSGEGLANKSKSLAIDYVLVEKIALQLKKIVEKGVQVSVVIGGGNFWRGASAEKNGIPRNRADHIGMIATIMNGLALQSGFEKAGLKARVNSSLRIDERVAEYYINEKTIKYLENGEVVIFVGGTSTPIFLQQIPLQHYMHQKLVLTQYSWVKMELKAYMIQIQKLILWLKNLTKLHMMKFLKENYKSWT